MSTQEGIIFILLILAALFFVARKKGWSPNWLRSNRLGAAMSSSKRKGGVMMALVAIIILVLGWIFWDDLAELHARWVGPGFPLWGYAAIVAGLIVVIWLLRMNKEQRAKSFHLAEVIIGIAAMVFSVMWFVSWEKEDARCPDKQAIISVPAQGMVVDLESCWDLSQIALDLRQVGVTELSFNQETAVLRGRTIREFARIVTHVPGSSDGMGMLRFNSEEMRRLGITTLSVFVRPSAIQPGAQANLTDADIAMFAQ